MYFQKTRDSPFSNGFNTTNNIPGSNVDLLAIKAGNPKDCNEYLNLPSLVKLFIDVPLI